MSDFEAVDLRIISYIQEGLSIATIARRLGVTGPRVTQRLTRMKKICDDPLVYRQGGRYHLTQVGEALLEFSGDVELSWVKFKKNVAKIKSDHGQLRITGIASILIEDVPSALDKVRKEFPHLRIKLMPATANEIVGAVAKGTADIGLIGALRSVQNLTFSKYNTERLVLLVAGSHPLTKFDEISFSQLERFTFIEMDHSNLMADLMDAAMLRSRIIPSFSITISDLETAAQMATKSTFGISLTLESIGSRYAKLNQGKVIRIKEPWAQIDMAVCTRDRTTLTAAQRFFIKMIEKSKK